MFAVKRSVFEFERESGVRPYPNVDIYICLIYVCKGMLVYTLRVVSHNAFCVVGAQLVSVKTNKIHFSFTLTYLASGVNIE